MNKLSFKNRINLGFGTIFLMMLFTTVYAIWQLHTVGQNMELVYEHPYKVSNAVRDIQIDIYKTLQSAKNLRFTETKRQLDSLTAEMENTDSSFYQNLKIVKSRYLGNKSDVDSVYLIFYDWKSTIDKLYRLKKENKIDSLDMVLKYENHDKAEHIIFHTKIISDFASNKAETTITKANEKKESAYYALISTIIIVTLLVIIISYVISRSINRPIKKFTGQAISIFSAQSEIPDFNFHHQEELFNYTLNELRKSYQNIEQQNEEIKSSNEQLSNFNKTLEEKVVEKTKELQENEATLKNQNDLFSALLKNLTVGVFMVEAPFGKPLLANEAALKLLGRGILPDVNKQNLSEVYKAFKLGTQSPYPPDEMPILLALNGKSSHVDDMLVERPDGTKTLLEIFGSPVTDSKGNVLASLVSFSDITERKQAERKLIESEKKYRNIFENAQEGMFQTKIDGSYISVNPALAKMYGFESPDELIKSRTNISTDAYFDPNERDHFLKLMNEQGFVKGYIYEVKHKDGRKIWFYEDAVAIKDDKGQIIYFEGFVIDITERKQAEDLLKTNERLLKESQLIAGLGSYVLDLTTGLWTSSTVLDSIFGIEANFVRSIENWVAFIHPEWQDTMAQYFANEVIGNKQRFDKDYKIVRAIDGQECWVHGLGELEFNTIGEPIKMIGTIMDITGRKEAELSLQQTNKNLEEMVYIASHDLQVPLVSMEGYATELLESYADKFDEEGKYCLIRLQANARRMHMLVLSLLDISRLNTKRNPYQKFNLNSIVDKIVKDISLTIEKQQATITVSKLPELFADKIRIESVFRNLIINALNYGGKNISLEYKNNNIMVKDDGIGLPESQFERIFNAGERLKKNNAEGVGMGLTFCRKVIEQHKGKIWAESEGENKGTIFYIKLP